MDWYIVIILGLIGIALFALEVFIIPGLGITGVLAIISQGACIYMAYKYGNNVGHYTTLFILGADILMVIFGFRQIFSGRWSVKEKIDHKLINTDIHKVKVGDIGTAHTILRPFGKALFHNELIEVCSISDFIDQESPIKVIKIEDGKIWVSII